MDRTMKYKILGHGFDCESHTRELIAIVDLVPVNDDRELLSQLPYVLDIDTSSVYAIIPVDRELEQQMIKALYWADMYKENTKTIREMLALFHDTQQNGRVLVDYAGNPFIVM